MTRLSVGFLVQPGPSLMKEGPAWTRKPTPDLVFPGCPLLPPYPATFSQCPPFVLNKTAPPPSPSAPPLS